MSNKALINSLFYGGENGIRTHERVASLHAFQACAFNHSATSPLPIKIFFFIPFVGLNLSV